MKRNEQYHRLPMSPGLCLWRVMLILTIRHSSKSPTMISSRFTKRFVGNAASYVEHFTFHCLFFLKVVNLLSRCTCPIQFYLEHLSEGKYRIGDTKTLIFVRVSRTFLCEGKAIFNETAFLQILRNHVMVRVGGGW